MPTKHYANEKNPTPSYSKRQLRFCSTLCNILALVGHPEALVGGNDITYSRHITAHDRIIYDIYDSSVTVLVVQAEEHSNDK